MCVQNQNLYANVCAYIYTSIYIHVYVNFIRKNVRIYARIFDDEPAICSDIRLFTWHVHIYSI